VELIDRFREATIKQSGTSISNTISAVAARTQLGQILRRAGEKDERFLVDRRGEPAVIIMSVKDYIRNIAPTPAAYRAARQEAKRKGAVSLGMREIDREIAALRRAQAKGKRKQPAA
jgi:prevent-host-death family protein